MESQGCRATWRMVYRRFVGDNFQLREILAKLLDQGKITETIVDAANVVYHTNRKV